MTWHPDIPHEYRNQIVTGDARELARAIPDESIDLIFTDPVYDRIDDYRWLAETAARVLKDGGSIVAQTGDYYRHEAEIVMRQSSLMPMPLLFDYFLFSHQTIYKYKLIVNARPYLWLSKGKANNDTMFMAQTSYQAMGRRNNGRPISKVYFKWGDDESYYLQRIKCLSKPDNTILDPFTGGGTVPAVCKMLQRNYIAFEIDPDTAELARERVRNTQPPLPLKYHEQLELLPGD